MTSLLRVALALVLAFGLSPVCAFGKTGPQPGPLPPAGSTAQAQDEEAAATAGALDEGTASDASAERTPDADTVSSPPSTESTQVDPTQAARYFLPNIGQATTAKLQSPWGACWAFAVAGAIESAILKAEARIAGVAQTALAPDSPAFADLNLTTLAASPDISERAIAWFAHEAQTEAAGNQAGEGFSLKESSATEQLSAGNFATAASALTAWQTLLAEDTAPYCYNGFDAAASAPWYQMDRGFDSRYEDWSLPSELRMVEDVDWRVSEVLRLESPVEGAMAQDGRIIYGGYDPAGTEAIKRTLVNVGGVAIALQMEQSIPQDVFAGEYYDAEAGEDFTFSTWSQYCASHESMPNHAALILGWDDTYPAANFQGTSSGQPPADGAWLCKNSWGNDALFESMGSSQDAVHWGLPDAEGASSGYFWLSYYDHSISDAEAFAVTPVGQSYDQAYQYDYVGAAEFLAPVRYGGQVRCANVFTAQDTQLLEGVSSWTFDPDGSFAVEVSTLPVGFDTNGKSANEMMEAATVVSAASAEFADAGFHTIALDTPVLVMAGQSFIISLVINAAKEDGEGTDGGVGNGADDASEGASEHAQDTYLGLEIAYLSTPADVQTTEARTVANEGETFVSTNGETWQSLAEFSNRYASQLQQAGRTMEFSYGNALVKGFANRTSMADGTHIYETVPLDNTTG